VPQHSQRFWPVIVFFALIAPAFGQDDAAVFNYVNNVLGVRPVVYYLDYVPIVPELVAYALRGLPFVVQAVLYRVLPLCVALMLYREWRRLLEPDGDRLEAGLLTLAAVLIVRAADPYIWANLMQVITPMFLIAVLHAVRIGRGSAPYSWWALPAMWLAAVSVPYGILLVPILLTQVWRGGNAARTWQSAGLALAIVAGYVWTNAYFLATTVRIGDPLAIAATFRSGFATEYRLYNVIVVIASLVLTAAVIEAWRRRRDRNDTLITSALAFVGLVSIAGCLVSDRLAFNDGGFGAAHALPALIAMLIVVSRAILRVGDVPRRAVLVGVFAGVAAAATGRVLYQDLRGPAEVALMKYQFLRDAEAFRRDCREGDAVVFEDEDHSPVVLCRPRHFADGLHPQVGFTPAVGVYDYDASPDERPFIYVGKPLF
jgi:hypothetical protein